MKKLILLSFIGLSMASCKPTMDKKSQYGFKGNWTLTEVSRIGDKYAKVTSFEIADADCFKGSQWKFVSNNNSGTIALTQGGACPALQENIKWVITPNGDFEFKFVDQGMKAKKVTTGFRLKVKNQTATSFDLVDQFYAGGKAYDLTYHFVKNN
ncbi:MAG: lipocalin family protein [Flavobacteriaceae bacterium]|jgi:hypothetical protein|nr:lipocalin family protein [Flavobacteriaceae bacterium]